VSAGEFAKRGSDTLKPEIFNTAAGAEAKSKAITGGGVKTGFHAFLFATNICTMASSLFTGFPQWCKTYPF